MCLITITNTPNTIASEDDLMLHAHRSIVLYDHENMAPKRLKGCLPKIDLQRIMAYIRDQTRVDSARFYTRQNKDGSIWHVPTSAGFETVHIHAKPSLVDDGRCPANADVELTMDAMDAVPDVDVYWIVSHDGSFTPLVERLKARGKLVFLICYQVEEEHDLTGHKCSHCLARTVDGVLELRDNPVFLFGGSFDITEEE